MTQDAKKKTVLKRRLKFKEKQGKRYKDIKIKLY